MTTALAEFRTESASMIEFVSKLSTGFIVDSFKDDNSNFVTLMCETLKCLDKLKRLLTDLPTEKPTFDFLFRMLQSTLVNAEELTNKGLNRLPSVPGPNYEQMNETEVVASGAEFLRKFGDLAKKYPKWNIQTPDMDTLPLSEIHDIHEEIVRTIAYYDNILRIRVFRGILATYSTDVAKIPEDIVSMSVEERPDVNSGLAKLFVVSEPRF
jgi:hypothetical protein